MLSTTEIYKQLYLHHVTEDKATTPTAGLTKKVMHADGCLWSSFQGFTLVRVPAGYPEEMEKIMVDRAGKRDDSRKDKTNPFEQVLPKVEDSTLIEGVTVKDLRQACKKVYRVVNREGRNKYEAIIKIGEGFYYAHIVHQCIRLLDGVGSNFEVRGITRDTQCLMLADESHVFDDRCALAYILPFLLKEDHEHPVFTIEEALAYEKPKKVEPENKAWYE